MIKRRITKAVRIGSVTIGNGERIAVQSMTNTETADKIATLSQINSLAECGCDIVRMTVNTGEAAENVGWLVERSPVPLVADIHFDYRLAIRCAESGIHKIRFNPGNIGSDDRVKALTDACKKSGTAIRVGVNSGSLEKTILEKYGSPTAEALAESAMYHVRLLENFDFDDIVISAKSSDVATTIQAYRLLSQMTDRPLHIGVTESGTTNGGVIKSAIGIGSLLADGIGDTIRVSLTGDPLNEVPAAKNILHALSLDDGINLVSCPTCGRTKYDMVPLVTELERRLRDYKVDRPFTVAVMGCVVNGPGEAKNADIGIAGGVNEGILFKKGIPIRRVPESEMLDALLTEIDEMVRNG